MSLDVFIEALLFYKATPQNKNKLCKLFDISEEELREGINRLSSRLQSGGVRLIETDSEIQLSTAPELAEFIESLRKQDLSGDIGKAGAETLSIILYKEPISRVEIDRIRGVNSSFIVRNLLIRGLITRESITGQGYQFKVSPKLLQHLGVENKINLPEFPEFMNAIDSFDKAIHE
jgi:segregation and condensation protein B